MDQTLILVNNKDEILGYGSRKICHLGAGKKHRAFVTLLYNSKKQVLLQKRKHKLFDGFWDLSAISHPLKINGHDETYQQASDRALKKEMGINHVSIKKVGAFNYFAKDGENCENEYCAILTGDYSGSFKPNNDEVYDSKWLDYKDFVLDVKINPKKYTPWAQEAVKLMEKVDSSLFFESLNNFLDDFRKYEKEYFKKKRKTLSGYPELISGLYENIQDFSRDGKAMRPYLVYLGYSFASGKDIKQILPVCMAVELMHNFLLIHDDIIDNSDVRRGKETVHKRYEKIHGQHYGISQAIIAGDIAFIEAFALINDLKIEGREFLIEYLLDTAYGEALDVEYGFKKALTAEILRVAELKTARYSFVGPLKLGAIIAGASDKILRAIEGYGKNVGIAFQLQDDILGVFGNEEILGKSVLSDIREGKNTLLFYKTKELASSSQLTELEKMWGNPKSGQKELKLVQEIIKKSGALTWCEKEMKKMIIEAKKYIASITKERTFSGILSEAADFVIERKK